MPNARQVPCTGESALMRTAMVRLLTAKAVARGLIDTFEKRETEGGWVCDVDKLTDLCDAAHKFAKAAQDVKFGGINRSREGAQQ